MQLLSWFGHVAFTRRNWRILIRFLPGLLVCIVLGCSAQLGIWRSPPTVLESPPLLTVARTDEPVAPLPLQIEGLNPDIVSLGEQLFIDPRLSGDNTIACASCHSLHRGGMDRQPVSTGVGGAKGTFNAPTVFNSAFNFRQLWDGRADSLEEQVDVTIHNAHEMGSSWPEIVDKLRQDENYRQQFQDIYGSLYQHQATKSNPIPEIAPDTIRDAIATYERSLITPNAPFDRYLRGARQALTPKQQDGYERFKAYGCISCHQGINIGGNMFQRFGILGNYFEDVGAPRPEDWGRYNVTGKEVDRYVFKVPSLRNVAMTPPYFHDGSIPTLEAAVSIMGKYQLGRVLTPEDIDVLVAFLQSLTGESPVGDPYRERP